MKKLLVILLTLICSSTLFAQGIVFEKGTFGEALAKAKQENKILFIDFYTTWCGPCKVVAKNVFPDPNVGDIYNSKFINYQIDTEKGEGIAIAEKYKVDAYPTFLYINGDGEVISRFLGMKNSEEFIAEARNIALFAKYGGIEKMENEFKNGSKNLEMLKDYYKVVDKEMKPKVLVQLLKSMPDEQLFNSENRYFDEDISYDFDLFNRLTDGIIVRDFDNEEYYFYVVFPVQYKLSKFLDLAIENNDQKLIKEILSLKHKYETVIESDYDYDLVLGRGAFFCSVDVINIGNDYQNADKKEFKKNFEAYFENFIAKTNIDSVKNAAKEATVFYEKLGEMETGYPRFIETYNYFSSMAYQWLDYFWKISPSDKKSRELCTKYALFIYNLNPLNNECVANIANILVRLNHKKDAISILENSIKLHKQFDLEEVKGNVEALEFELMTVKNNK